MVDGRRIDLEEEEREKKKVDVGHDGCWWLLCIFISMRARQPWLRALVQWSSHNINLDAHWSGVTSGKL